MSIHLFFDAPMVWPAVQKPKIYDGLTMVTSGLPPYHIHSRWGQSITWGHLVSDPLTSAGAQIASFRCLEVPFLTPRCKTIELFPKQGSVNRGIIPGQAK